jgi:hypothetical protein
MCRYAEKMRYPTTRSLAVLAATLLLGACTASEVDRDARIDIGGVVARQNGDPVAGVRAAMSREADLGEVFTVFTTLGLACIDAHTDVCLGSRVTRTNSDGRFAYVLTGKDTQGFVGQASTMVLTAGIGPRPDEVSGPSTTYRFQVQTEKLDLPVRVWEPRLDGATGSFGARVTWTAVPGRVLPPGLGSADRSYSIAFARGDEVVWNVGGARSGFAFDARVLEDSTGTGAVVAAIDGEKVSDELGRRIDIALRSGARAYESPAGPPPSRGRACFVADADGQFVAQSPCRLTDGEFSDDFSPTVCGDATGCVEPTQLSTIVDLGTRRSVSLVVVRGCANRCTIETSRDRRTWRTAGVAAAEDAALRMTPPVSARFVRVSAPVSIAGLREVSAWTGGGGVAAGPLFVEPGALEPPGSPGSTASPRAVVPIDRGNDSSTLRLVAVGVLCAVGGALATILVSRRKRRRPAPR